MFNWLGRSKLSQFNFRLELQKKYVDISMHGYIPTALHKFQKNHQHAPKTPHIHGIKLFMANTSNYLLRKYPRQNSTLQTQTVYNPSMAPFYNML